MFTGIYLILLMLNDKKIVKSAKKYDLVSHNNLNNLDSSEYYYKIVAEKTNISADWYNYSHLLYMNEKFDEAEQVMNHWPKELKNVSGY